MDFEYVYLLKNDNIPRLVKFGTTKNDPVYRAKQLSQETGVPGRYRVVKSWRVKDGYKWEQFVFSKLSSFRKTGEFFALSPEVAVNKINIILSENGALEDIETFEIEQAKAHERELFLEERKRRIDDLWNKNEGRIKGQSLQEAERRLGYTEKSIRSQIANAKSSSTPYKVAETVQEPFDFAWGLLNMVTLFIPMIIAGILSSVTNTKIPSANEIAGSMDDKTREQLNALNQKANTLDTEHRRLFEVAKQNYYKTGCESDTLHKSTTFGDVFTSSVSSEPRRYVTSIPSYSSKKTTGKPPNLILKCPSCQTKNRWARESFVGGTIKCGSCGHKWEVDELGVEVTWRGL